MRHMTEEIGARKAILEQAQFYPKEGLSDNAFLKVLIPPQQAIGRLLLCERYLTRNDCGNIVLSDLVKQTLPPPTWGENMKAFLLRLTTCLAEAVVNCKKADHWAEQARWDPERLRVLVLLHNRESDFPLLETRLSHEACSLLPCSKIAEILPAAKRRILIESTIAIEERKNRVSLDREAILIVPTLENVLQMNGIPEQLLFYAYDWLSELYIMLDDKRAQRYIDNWRLLKAASSPSFEAVERGLSELYDPRAGDKTVGEMLKRRKEQIT